MKKWRKLISFLGLIVVLAGVIAAGCSILGDSVVRSPAENSSEK